MVACICIGSVFFLVFVLSELLHHTFFCNIFTHAFYLLIYYTNLCIIAIALHFFSVMFIHLFYLFIYDIHSRFTAAALHFFLCHLYSFFSLFINDTYLCVPFTSVLHILICYIYLSTLLIHILPSYIDCIYLCVIFMY